MYIVFHHVCALENRYDGVMTTGIFIKINKNGNFKQIDFLAKRYNLKKGKFHSNLKLQQYVHDTGAHYQKLKTACQEMLKLSEVLHCEQDIKLKSRKNVEDLNKNAMLGNNKIFNTSQRILLNQKAVPQGCKLIPDEIESIRNGLSPYWAQEYTGADLSRKLLEEKNGQWQFSSDLIHVLDSATGQHKDYVKNLILSSHPSALIPVQDDHTDINFVNMEKRSSPKDTTFNLSDGVYISNYVEYFENLTAVPSIINNSMGWANSEVISDIVCQLANKNVLFITSAGNKRSEVIENLKESAAVQDGIILVSSSNPEGFASGFSSYGEEILVSAPSNHELISYGSSKRYDFFGGTSGAVPQVTAALASFEMLSGYHLSAQEAKKLLLKTAIKIVTSYDQPAKFGRGSLNSYKISLLGLRLKERCHKFHSQLDKFYSCASEQLNSNDFYYFDVVDANMSKKVLGECFGQDQVENYSCDTRRSHFRLLREQAMLNPDRDDLWRGIGCEYAKQGFNINAIYYSRLAQLSSTDNYQKIDLTSGYTAAEILIFLQQPSFQHRTDILEILMAKVGENDNTWGELKDYILQSPQTQKYLLDKYQTLNLKEIRKKMSGN